jgi:hypothetical protein
MSIYMYNRGYLPQSDGVSGKINDFLRVSVFSRMELAYFACFCWVGTLTWRLRGDAGLTFL